MQQLKSLFTIVNLDSDSDPESNQLQFELQRNIRFQNQMDVKTKKVDVKNGCSGTSSMAIPDSLYAWKPRKRERDFI